jgi:hypothetical protein
VWDFGDVKVGTQGVSHDFVLHNPTREPLTIDSLRVSCGSCIEASIDKRRIEPGKRAYIKVSLITEKAKRGTAQVFVNTDLANADAERLLIKYNITASPKPKLTFSPRLLDLGLCLVNQRRDLMLEIVNQGQTPIEINGTNLAQLASLEVKTGTEFPLTIKANETKSLDFTFTPDKDQTGYYQRTIRFQSPGRSKSAFVIVKAYIATEKEVRNALSKSEDSRNKTD